MRRGSSLLSQTGAFTDLATLTARAGCIPYELNVPFWSDPAWSAWKPDFEAYDVVVQNTSNIQTVGNWPRETELALEEYVHSGGRSS